MQKKEKLSFLIKLIVFFLVIVGMVYGMSVFFKDTDNGHKYTRFYSEEENFDVLFFGSSRMLNAVYPMELWQEHGITSFNMAMHGEKLRITYWQMVKAFETNKPKVAVVDMSLYNSEKIAADDKDSLSYLHKSIDYMPLSAVKIKAINDILGEDADKFQFYFPLAIYHNRWTELKRSDFYPSKEILKGMECRNNTEIQGETKWASGTVSTNLQNESPYFEKIVNLCKENNVELVLTVMPSNALKGYEPGCKTVNAMEAFADDNGIPFINFAKDDAFLDYTTDFSDISHVNYLGAMKVTHMLSDFLYRNYTFDSKNKNTIEKWNADTKEYIGWKESIAEPLK